MQVAKIVRIGSMVVGGVAGSLLLAAFIVPPMLDWNEYRDEVESAASSALSQSVKIDGDLEVRLLPVPTVSVDALRIETAGQEAPIATVGSLDVALSVMPLIAGNLEVSNLTLSEVKLSMLESPDGEWSINGLAMEGGSGESAGIQLDDVRIENSEITLIQSTGTVTTVADIALKIEGKVPDGPVSWSGNASVHGVAIRHSGRMQVGSVATDKSIRIEAGFAGSDFALSGKVSEDGFSGRLTVDSDNAALMEQAINTLTQQHRNSQLPTEPLELDARLEFAAGKGNIETKRIMLGKTSARAEITILGTDKKHFSGKIAVGSVDLDSWSFLEQEAVESSDDGSAADSGLSGDFEITVDAIQWHDKAVRQIDIAVGLDGEVLRISKVQALVPGGGTLSSGGIYRLSGDSPSFKGRIGLKTGGLRDLLAWFGTDISTLPEGRLMSLDVRSGMTLAGNRFQLGEINARLDDSTIKGSLDFDEDYALSGVELNIDRINLDAYLPASTDGKAHSDEQEPFKTPQHIKLSVGDLILKDTKFSNVSVTSDQAPGSPAKIAASAGVYGGTNMLQGTVQDLTMPDAFSLQLSGKNIDKAQLLTSFSQASSLTNSIGGKTVNYRVQLDGTLDNMSIDADVSSGTASLGGKGSLSIVDDSLSEVDILGKLQLADSAAFMQVYEIEGARGPLNLDVTVAGKMNGGLNLRIAGAVAGSELISKGILTLGGEGKTEFKGDVNLAVGAVDTLPASLQYIPALAGLRLKSDVAYSSELLGLDNIDVAIAGGRVTGDITLGGADYKAVSGKLLITGLRIEDAPSKPATLSQPWSKQAFHPLPTAGMQGAIDVNIKSLSYKGQDVTNSSGKVSFSGDGIAMAFDRLTLNDAPAKFDFSVTDQQAVRQMDIAVDARSIRMAPLLQSLTGKVVTEGEANLDFNVKGQGKSAYTLVSSLSGQAKFDATAGTLKFMDLPKLAAALRNPASGVGAIRSIGGMLGKGNSSFSKLDGAAKIDKGVINITQLYSAGDWGTMDMTGPVNLVPETMNLNGVIRLAQPTDIPEIGMSFVGPITEPRKKFATDSLLRYVLAKVNILRRDEAQKEGESQQSPSEALVGKALDLFGRLKKKKKDPKKDNEGN